MSFHYYSKGKEYRIAAEVFLLIIYLIYWREVVLKLIYFWNKKIALKLVYFIYLTPIINILLISYK